MLTEPVWFIHVLNVRLYNTWNMTRLSILDSHSPGPKHVVGQGNSSLFLPFLFLLPVMRSAKLNKAPFSNNHPPPPIPPPWNPFLNVFKIELGGLNRVFLLSRKSRLVFHGKVLFQKVRSNYGQKYYCLTYSFKCLKSGVWIRRSCHLFDRSWTKFKSVSMRKPGRTRQEVIQLNSPISLKLSINVRFGE